ncbi:hypothetical protein KUTeg_020138 [Tegillarca granosa]|uniref:Secreted protein n=1 Tax=Tegillarca granosa TaxID=220873 RepID=A0ABQ9EBF6_TEGGR|nr:hypothetical protein KUTeg_020138 [Tegillarca granosa]
MSYHVITSHIISHIIMSYIIYIYNIITCQQSYHVISYHISHHVIEIFRHQYFPFDIFLFNKVEIHVPVSIIRSDKFKH